MGNSEKEKKFLLSLKMMIEKHHLYAELNLRKSIIIFQKGSMTIFFHNQSSFIILEYLDAK